MKRVIILLSALSFTSAAYAGLAEKKAMREFAKDTIQEIAETTKACGSKIAVNWNFKSLSKSDFKDYSLKGMASDVLYGVRSVCADPDGKDAVKKQVKKILLTKRTKGDNKPTFNLKSGTLKVMMKFAPSNTIKETKKFLEDNL
ncbi:hypothetical protein N9D31_00895 [Oligoflexaceae bacterium]|nr:hypothetical protein [Oligoflexaceae bacterium]